MFFNINQRIRREVILVGSLLVAYNSVSIFSREYSYFMFPFYQVLGFLLLTFVPGYLIFRISSIQFKNSVLDLVLIIGLSLSVGIISGLIFTVIGIVLNLNLISFEILLIYYDVVVLMLLIILFLRNPTSPTFFEIRDLRKYALQANIVLIISALAIAGVYLLNNYSISTLLIIMTVLISLMPFLYRYNDYHWVLIFSASLSILISYHLVSDYLWGWDIHKQYYYASQVLENAFWNPHNLSNQNSLLSIVVLAPIYSIMLDLDLVWVFKVIYPTIFSTIPLLVYFIADKITKVKTIAYLSSFLFIFYYGFFKDMIDKQLVAEFFLLAMLIIVFASRSKAIILLSFIFLTMLIFSHYGVSWIFFIAFFLSALIHWFTHRDKISQKILLLLAFFGITLIYWELMTSCGITFTNIVNIGGRLIANLPDILTPDARSGVSYLSYGNTSVLWNIYKILNMAIIFFIILGIGFNFRRLLSCRIKPQISLYELIAYVFATIIVLQSIITFGLGMDRVLQITLTLLAPFAVLGFIGLLNLCMRVFPMGNTNVTYTFFALFLCIFFMFSSGLIHAVANDPLPYSINLGQNPDWHVYSSEEVNTLDWLKDYGEDRKIAIVNPYSAIKTRDGTIVSGKFGEEQLLLIPETVTEVSDAFIYIGGQEYFDQNNSLYQKVIPHADLIHMGQNTRLYLT